MEINEERKSCKMCGKMLPEQEMFRKIEDEGKDYYVCCHICYEMFSGEPLSDNPDIKYE